MQYGHENPMARVKLIVTTVILEVTLIYVTERSSDHIEAHFSILMTLFLVLLDASCDRTSGNVPVLSACENLTQTRVVVYFAV
ncbi:hypothetical protein KUL42_40890 [Alteromonas sp. KUL42]|nr:hypothetical protein KUL42_40890 [Alteromonas sp. KUL42]